MLVLSVIIVFLLFGALWLAAVLHEHGLKPMRKMVGLMKRPAAEITFVALVAIGMIHHGATKGTNGVNGAGGETGDRGMSGEVGGLRNLPPEIEALSNALAITAFDIDVPNREVAFELSWASNLFDYTDSRNLFLFSATNLQDRQWTPVGEFLMPSGSNVHAFAVTTNDVYQSELGWFLDSFNGIGFYRFAADLDSDGDGLIDSCETWWTFTDPGNPDTDGDGLTDGQEISAEIGTNPLLADTDGDGVGDADEIAVGTNPHSADSDGDGLTDCKEMGGWEYYSSELPVFDVSGGTNLLDSSKNYYDSVFVVPLPFDVMCAGLLHTNATIGVNGLVGLMCAGSKESFSAGYINYNLHNHTLSQYHTGVAAYWDDLHATKNGGSQITVADVVTNGHRYCVVEYSRMQQYSLRTNTAERGTFQIVIPHDETNVVYVHYIEMSQAFDGSSASIGAQLPKRLRNFDVSYNAAGVVTNGMVLAYRFGSGTDPLVADTDGDGLDDGMEFSLATCPWKFDTDGDGLDDGWEVGYGLDPLSTSGDDGAEGDPDGDTLRNLKEYEYGTNPTIPDTDGDGLSDAEETGSITISTNGIPWLSFDAFDDLTTELAASSKRCVTVGLSSPLHVQYVMVTNLTISYRGLLFLDRAGYANAGNATGSESFKLHVDRNAFVIAPYLGYHNLYTNLSERSSSIRVGTATHGGAGYLLVEWANMYGTTSSSSTNAISFQVAIPTNRADRAFVRYCDVAGPYMTGRYGSIGMQTLDGRWLHSYCHQQSGKIWEGLSLTFLLGANSDPRSDDIDFDGLLDAFEASIGTDPMQPDTDGDGMEDGWELTYGFDPVTHNSQTPRQDDDGTADPDGDDLTNAEECEWGTNPSGADEDGDGQADGYDTDGDGASDGAEVSQNSDPSDATDLGAPNSRVAVPFHFGDPSTSHSEKYRLELEPIAGPGETPTGFSWVNANYGECETKTAMLKEGWKYAVRMYHSGTSPQYHGDPRPDYDYSLELASGTPETVALHDPSGLFGENGNSGTSFTGAGKVAYIYVLAPPEIVAPETVGANQDDDNGNGTPDFDDVGEVAGDDDLVEMKVRVRCPAGLSGTVTVDVYGYLLNGRMWRDRARTQRVETQDTFTVNGDTERSYYVEGETFSVGHLTESFRVRFQCLGKTLASEHRFTFVYRIAEPITTERVGGNLVNPCCAIVGANTPMRIDVRPQGFPDSKIKWSVDSGEGTFAGADTGRDVSFVAGGSDGDSVTLKVEVGDCPGAPPQFTLRTTAMHEVKIYPCAISDEENPSMITDAHVTSLLDGVNAIFRQVGLHFSLGAPVMNVTNNTWARNGLIENGIGTQIRDVMSGTDGLEVYFIAGSGNDDEPVGLYNAYGIILRNSADAIALAHEIGHSCGWPDIYFYRGSVVPSELNQKLRATWMPNDWNNGSGCRFYDPILSQRDIIQRLLMNGVKVDAQSDIPLGSVFGLSVDSVTGMMNVGRNGILTVSPQSN